MAGCDEFFRSRDGHGLDARSDAAVDRVRSDRGAWALIEATTTTKLAARRTNDSDTMMCVLTWPGHGAVGRLPAGAVLYTS